MGYSGCFVGEIVVELLLFGVIFFFYFKELVVVGLVMVEVWGCSICYCVEFDVMNGLIGYLIENCCVGDVVCGLDVCCMLML